ncbi:hypothetical protein M0R04_09565 [Candidatus Dojkabacteria bacterium]|jgi:hypothetical protein|nr:hypothetical protein [Candidatus Dojkabacteria bacterium]
MVRTLGALDLHKRKTRKDKGKRKKPVQLKRFAKHKGHKTHLKLWMWREEPMSLEGYRHWHTGTRMKIRRVVYKFDMRIDVPVERLATKERIEAFVLETISYKGVFLFMGGSGSLRSKKGFKWVKLFKCKITEHPDGLQCRMTNNYRLFRYFFWCDK